MPRHFQRVEDLGMEGSDPQGAGPASDSGKWSILDCGDDAPLAEEPSREVTPGAHTDDTYSPLCFSLSMLPHLGSGA